MDAEMTDYCSPPQIPTRRLFTRFNYTLSYALSYALLPGHCVLCKSTAERPLDLCAFCENDLPLIGRQCAICSVPLPNLGSDSKQEMGQDIKPGSTTCGDCLNQPPVFSHTLAPYLYQSPVDHLLSRFKFSGDLVAGKVLGQLLAQHVAKHTNRHTDKHTNKYNNKRTVTSPDQILPVPLHWRRQFKRGFNQANEIAMILGQTLGIPVNNRLVKRVVHTPSQLKLNHQQRQKNLRNAFAMSNTGNGQSIRDKSFAIVDDVITTGSTADSLAKLLIKNGARQVAVWAIARTVLEN
jgi:ComF family protein